MNTGSGWILWRKRKLREKVIKLLSEDVTATVYYHDGLVWLGEVKWITSPLFVNKQNH
jgi:hypothetical protein